MNLLLAKRRYWFPLFCFYTFVLLHPVCAEDWVIGAKTYKGVTVLKVEADAVTIMYADGGGLIPLAKMPPDLQKRFHYDAAKAALAAQARREADAANAKALQAEIDYADALRQAKLVADDPVYQKALKAAEKAKTDAEAAAAYANSHQTIYIRQVPNGSPADNAGGYDGLGDQ